MSRRSIGRVGAALVLAASAIAAVAAPAAAVGAADLTGLKYVALGDSYASGLGLGDYTAVPSISCGQSNGNAAHQVAAAYGLQLTDVSCAGATTANVVGSPQALAGGVTVPAQLDAVTPDTDLITLTVGGNDLGFATIISGCAAASPAGPLLLDPARTSCASAYTAGGVDRLAAHLDGVVAPALDATLAALRATAPGATIIVVGYPTIAPVAADSPPAGCFSPALGAGLPPQPLPGAYPFTGVDQQYIAGIAARLDAAHKAAAEKHGATFVSLLDSTRGHSPCAGTAEPYIDGVTLTSIAPPAVSPNSLHPNRTGVSAIEAMLSDAIAAAFPAPTAPGAGPSETPGTPSAGAATAAPAAASATSELANTGSETLPVLAGGVLLLVVGAGVVVWRRRAGRHSHRSL